MQILITGHKGYLGTVLTPMLSDAGHDIYGVDCDLYRECTFGSFLPSCPESIQDVRDLQPEDFSGFDAVIHLAALSNDPLGDINPETTDEINYKMAVRTAQIAKKAGVSRFLFASSCSSYGKGGDNILNETSPLNPITLYAVSKVKAEEEISKLASLSFSPTFLRCATAYGSSPRNRFDLVVNNLVGWAYTTGKIHLKSDGSAWRPIIHIQDIALAFSIILTSPKNLIHNEIFNVGSNHDVHQICKIAEIIENTLPNTSIEYASDPSHDERNYLVNFDKLNTTFPNFKTQWKLEDAILDLFTTYAAAKLQLHEFEGGRYERVAHLKSLIKNKVILPTLRWNTLEYA